MGAMDEHDGGAIDGLYVVQPWLEVGANVGAIDGLDVGAMDGLEIRGINGIV